MITLSEDEIADCVRRLIDVQTRIAELSSQADSLKTVLRALGPLSRHPAAGVLLTITPNRRFDGSKAKQLLPARTFADICVPRPDPAAARRVLTPEVYASCCTDGDMIVRLT